MGSIGEPLNVMAKIYGLFGAMSGKVADVVMSVRNGQQIVRKYQPVVANPKSQKQFGTRARFKLLSQLSAVMAPVIAFRRVGSVSPRNIFTKVNFPATSFSDMNAEIDLVSVKLTNGVLSNDISSATAVNNQVTVTGTVSNDVDKVVCILFDRSGDELRLRNSTVVDVSTNTYTADLGLFGPDAIVYTYGIRLNTSAARVYFGNLEVTSAEMVAELIVSTTLLENDVTLTETAAAIVTQGA